MSTDGVDATTRNMVLDIAERLSSVDGPLVGDGDREEVEELVGRMFEAIGGARHSDAEIDPDDLVIEADGDDTHWRKETEVGTLRAECGPFLVTDEGVPVDVDNAYLEVAPIGNHRGRVCVDTNIEGEYQGVDHNQGALHYLTPRQARTFAAALLEQAECVENQQTER